MPFRSGSEALFQALTTLRAASERHRAATIALPAYCCPRVLGAVVGAGWRPAFVDLIPDGLAMNLSGVADALDFGASVVLAADLFGVPTVSDGLRTACSRAGATLIRDLAQSFLDEVGGEELGAEIGVLSFGRGKPTSVLSGGALLVNKKVAANLASAVVATSSEATFSAVLGGLRALAYDLAIQPIAYSFVRRIPGLHLGESRLVITKKAQRLPEGFLSLVAGQFSSTANLAEIRSGTAKTIAFVERSSTRVLPAAKTALQFVTLSRVPALAASADAAERIRAHAAHLGVTGMYLRTLGEFQGDVADEAQRCYPNAFAMSRRLLTFPAGAKVWVTSERELSDLLT